MNITTSKDGILLGNISYQITGLPPFTDNPMSTIGNDWSLPHSILSPAHVEKFNEMALSIGEKMRSEGWRGLFGIDAVYDEERDRILLIEINSRQPASATFESELQSEARAEGVPGITMFEAHLLALTDAPASENIMAINDGSQIVQRVTKATTDMNTGGLEKAGYKVIKYNNTKLNSDRLRIQSRKGIMEAHNKFNARGKEIEKLLK
ncbi:MAG: hypothetical protein Q8Q03_03240 [bacterium]|nr:hypothetical protein [bacterium]